MFNSLVSVKAGYNTQYLCRTSNFFVLLGARQAAITTYMKWSNSCVHIQDRSIECNELMKPTTPVLPPNLGKAVVQVELL